MSFIYLINLLFLKRNKKTQMLFKVCTHSGCFEWQILNASPKLIFLCYSQVIFEVVVIKLLYMKNIDVTLVNPLCGPGPYVLHTLWGGIYIYRMRSRAVDRNGTTDEKVCPVERAKPKCYQVVQRRQIESAFVAIRQVRQE